ncbi:MAG: hypothetical protein ACOC2U_04905 [bacterium]
MIEIINILTSCLSDDLLHDKYKKNRNNYLSGHCYIMTEALYYILDDDDRKNYVPSTLKINNITHWFLKNRTTGDIIDPTKNQFNFDLDYNKSRNRFFLTKKPSKRTLILLNRFYEKNNY